MSGIELNEHGLPKTLALPCIYQITNLVTGDFYIGSAWKGSVRRQSHWGKLERNKHENRHLQNAWNKYGIGCFEFTYLRTFRPEEMTREALYTLEQSYMDYLKPVYNIARDVRHPTTTAEQRQAMSDRQSRPYIVTSPAGTEQRIMGLKPFCRANGLDASAMSRVLKGEWAHHRGWKVRKADGPAPAPEDGRLRREWLVTSPDGCETVIKNLKAFCRERGLIDTNMREVAVGRSSHHRGWMCRYATDDKQPYVKRGRAWQGDKACSLKPTDSL